MCGGPYQLVKGGGSCLRCREVRMVGCSVPCITCHFVRVRMAKSATNEGAATATHAIIALRMPGCTALAVAGSGSCMLAVALVAYTPLQRTATLPLGGSHPPAHWCVAHERPRCGAGPRISRGSAGHTHIFAGWENAMLSIV